MKNKKSKKDTQKIIPLNLVTGEWVEVKSQDEIEATLDKRGHHKGLLFMHEMRQFCGGKYKVHKVITKMILETTGEMRQFKSPTVILEGVHCDGSYNDGCQRSCFLFWKEAWLKRAEINGE